MNQESEHAATHAAAVAAKIAAAKAKRLRQAEKRRLLACAIEREEIMEAGEAAGSLTIF